MPVTDGRIDERIAKAPAFARPVMRHLRALVHEGCPEAEETIKWGQPFFLHRGRMMCAVAAFSKHCGFRFVVPQMEEVMRAAGMPVDEAAGSLGRITSIADLPADTQMLAWIRQAAEFAGSDAPATKRGSKMPKPEAETPGELLAALKKKKGAQAVFDGFSPSCRREYAEWVAEAKRPETRERRVAQAVEWIAEGKTRNWKYQNC